MRIKFIDCTSAPIFEKKIDAAEDSSKKMLNSVYNADLKKMKKLIENYNYGDKEFPHPVLWEVIEQAGCNSETSGNPHHMKLNEQLKFFLTNPKFQNIMHHDEWRDKYGNTAYQRLAGSILCMKDPKLLEWIQTSDFGLGKEYNKYLTPENITRYKDNWGQHTGYYILSKFPDPTCIVDV